MSAAATIVQPALARFDRMLGGRDRRKVVVILALVLGLDAADKATLGAVGAELQRGLHISNLDLGVLAAVSLGVAGLVTVPIGALTDRMNRTKLLAASVLLWGAALVVSGAASSFGVLLCTRVALGALGATTGPTIASLVGDYFPTHDRARMYGYILAGEIVGAGFGFVVSGEITAVLSWRWGFWILVAPAVVLAWVVARMLPEPARGGHDEGEQLTVAQEIAREEGVEPDESLVLERDPAHMALPDAIRYVLRIPTNRILIVASALGWFFFAGVRTFAVIFIRGRWGVGQAEATAVLALIGAGALVGVLIGGILSDRLIERGRLRGRVTVAFVGYLLTPLLLAPGILSDRLLPAVCLFFAGTMALGAANPPVDAGRLDVTHHGIWGRAEGVRTLARTWAEATAPIAFGGISQLIAGGSASPFSAEGAARTDAAQKSVSGLKWAFMVMLVPLLAGAFIGLRARETYPRDAAAAGESEERLQPDG